MERRQPPILAVGSEQIRRRADRDALREALDALDPDAMTPREALDALYRLKAQR